MTATLRFTGADVDRANAEWGCNCGPAAIAAALDKTLDEVRPHLAGFASRHYMNPTMMWATLGSLGVTWRRRDASLQQWPDSGIVRVQWEGPWTQPGVPARAAYRYTHWIAGRVSADRQQYLVFDVNCLDWIHVAVWRRQVVPEILRHVPRASGRWHMTHSVDLDRSRPAP